MVAFPLILDYYFFRLFRCNLVAGTEQNSKGYGYFKRKMCVPCFCANFRTSGEVLYARNPSLVLKQANADAQTGTRGHVVSASTFT